MTLERVDFFAVPSDVIDATDRALCEAGQDGYELFVLWTGRQTLEGFAVEHWFIPEQTSYREEAGLHVRVEADELDRLNRWLYQNQQLLAVQVHSHPTEAFHSDTDDEYAIATAIGCLSIVVPNFGRQGILGPGTAVYRLQTSGWIRCDGPLESIVRVL